MWNFIKNLADKLFSNAWIDVITRQHEMEILRGNSDRFSKGKAGLVPVRVRQNDKHPGYPNGLG